MRFQWTQFRAATLGLPIGLALIGALPIGATAAPASVRLVAPAEQRVDEGTAGSPTDIAALELSDGSFLVAWSRAVCTGDGSILARHVDPSGRPVGKVSVLVPLPAGPCTADVTLATLEDGRILVGYEIQAGMAGPVAHVVAVEPAGTVQELAALDSGVKMRRLQAGGMIVLTSGTDGKQRWIDAFRIDSVGHVNDPFRVVAGPEQTYGMDAAQTATGGFVFTWYQRAATAMSSFVRRFDDDGVAQTEPLALPSGDGSSAVDADGAGGYMVAWTADADVRVQAFDDSGAERAPSSRANVNPMGLQHAVAVRYDLQSHALVLWQSARDGAHYHAAARLFSGDGTRLTQGTPVATTGSEQRQPLSVRAPSGGFLVVWWGRGGRAGSGIYARRFTLGT